MKLIRPIIKTFYNMLKTEPNMKPQTPGTRITNIKKIFRQYELDVHILKNGATRMKITLHKGDTEVFFKIIKAYFQNECEFIDQRNYILKFNNIKNKTDNNSFTL